MFSRFKRKFIGNREFYKVAFGLMIPMMLQNLLTNFVNLVDNIMVGRVGTEQMSAVAIVNQFQFIFMLALFGAVSGGSIYGAQFFGNKDAKGQRETIRYRMYLNVLLSVVFIMTFYFYGQELIGSFLNDNGEIGDPALCATYAWQYMRIMLWGMLPMAIATVYASVLKEVGNTSVPMYASGCAVFANILLDYALIFGKLGCPELGVEGAAYATVISKFIEMFVVVIWLHTHEKQNPYMKGVYHSFKIPLSLLGKLIWVGIPLMVNELLWSGGMTLVFQCYSVRGMEAVAATNICIIVMNLINVFCLQGGNCISILVGQKLGAGRLEDAKDCDNKLIFFSEMCCFVIMVLILPFGRLFPEIYNTQQEIKDLAGTLIIITAFALPLQGFCHCAYFTIRSGGRTWITFVFDSIYTWLVNVALAYVLVHYTTWSLPVIYGIVTYSEIIKATIGYKMVRSNMWMRNIVS